MSLPALRIPSVEDRVEFYFRQWGWDHVQDYPVLGTVLFIGLLPNKRIAAMPDGANIWDSTVVTILENFYAKVAQDHGLIPSHQGVGEVIQFGAARTRLRNHIS